MTQNIEVSCLINRSWDYSEVEWEGALVDGASHGWDGDLVSGTLIDISTQTADDGSGKIIPVGIVLLDDNTFQSVPVEFIYKNTI